VQAGETDFKLLEAFHRLHLEDRLGGGVLRCASCTHVASASQGQYHMRRRRERTSARIYLERGGSEEEAELIAAACTELWQIGVNPRRVRRACSIPSFDALRAAAQLVVVAIIVGLAFDAEADR